MAYFRNEGNSAARRATATQHLAAVAVTVTVAAAAAATAVAKVVWAETANEPLVAAVSTQAASDMVKQAVFMKYLSVSLVCSHRVPHSLFPGSLAYASV